MKFNENVKPEENEQKEEKNDIISMLLPEDRPELRVTGIYGDVNEERCSEAIYGLHALTLTACKQIIEDPSDPESEIVNEYSPIEFIVSTHGGLAAEMFSVYDAIRETRETTPVHTKGLGKVMSAGVLLLAAGTKGKRRIGRYCRVMIHGVMAGQHGYLADVENEFNETKAIQKMYVDALSQETNMTKTEVRKIMNKKSNVYFNAEEAVKMGIADIIF